jgi:hypothetical protein
MVTDVYGSLRMEQFLQEGDQACQERWAADYLQE